MLILFRLSLPSVRSRNGEDFRNKIYAIIKNVPKRNVKIKTGDYFFYDFGDGWKAGIRCSIITAKEAAKIRRKINGFCGYEWMVDDIIKNGKIGH